MEDWYCCRLEMHHPEIKVLRNLLVVQDLQVEHLGLGCATTGVGRDVDQVTFSPVLGHGNCERTATEKFEETKYIRDRPRAATSCVGNFSVPNFCNALFAMTV